MRYGVISDIHANLHALDAVLELLAGQDVDGYLCTGDLVGYGPLPNECVARVMALPGHCIAGNHDLIAIGRLSDDRCIPLARESLRWTRSVLGAQARGQLASLPLGARVHDVALRHGSVLDPQAYVLTRAQAHACLDDLQRVEAGAQVLILGHTHRPMAIGKRRGWLLRETTGTIAIEPDEPIVLNPGAVGQSRGREVVAQAMVLDLGQRAATFHAVRYDVEGCRQALRERGLPPQSCELPLARQRRLGDAIKAAARRVSRLRSAEAR